LPGSVPIHAQNSNEILDRHISAIGGKELINKVQTIIIKQKFISDNVETITLIYSKRPNFYRQEYYFKEATIIRSYNGKEAWMQKIFPDGSIQMPTILSPEKTKLLIEDLIYPLGNNLSSSPLNKEPFSYISRGIVNGRSVYILKSTGSNQVTETSFIDDKTYLEIRRIQSNAQNKQEREINYDDFRTTSGLKIPFHITESINSKIVMETKILDFIINNTVPVRWTPIFGQRSL